jgi:AbrB family looped-hinge helix DNA binding protein
MLSVKVSTKHQIVVPSAVRRQLGIKAGDRLEVRVERGEVVLHPRPARASERLRGLGKGMYGPDPVGYVRELRDEWEDRLPERER